jgi:hypothetical protein
MLRRLPVLPLIAALTACASAQDQYPSLAIRPAERATGTLQPVSAEPVLTPLAPAMLDKVSQLATDARANHQAFLAQVSGARPAISGGRGAPVGSEAWARAEAALADVRAARSKTMVPLADLDRLLVDAGTKGEATDRIAAARDQIEGLLTSEDRTVAELSANLP